MSSKLMKCSICNGSGDRQAEDASDPANVATNATGEIPPCSACGGTGLRQPLTPEQERRYAEEAKTVIARMSGMETCWDVYVKLHGRNDALALIFLGTLGDIPTDQLGPECKRQWPRQYKSGLRLIQKQRSSNGQYSFPVASS